VTSDRDTNENDLSIANVLDDRAYARSLRERSAALRARADAFRKIARDILSRSRSLRGRHQSDRTTSEDR